MDPKEKKVSWYMLDGAVGRFFRYMFDFHGRSSRKDYWWPQLLIYGSQFLLLVFIATIYLSVPRNGSFASELSTTKYWTYVFLMGILGRVAMLGLQARRFHDQDDSAMKLLFNLIPFVGDFVVLIMMLGKSARHENIYGDETKTTTMDTGEDFLKRSIEVEAK